MGLFDFLKPKRKGITDSVFQSQQYQNEMIALGQTLYFEHNHSYDAVRKGLIKEGLSEEQAALITIKVEQQNKRMVDSFQADMDSGKIADLKIQPNPEHQKGNVSQDQIDKYIGFGCYQMEREDYANALELFDKALELDNRATLAYANKGNLYLRQNDEQKALEYYNKALEIEPDHVPILENKLNLLFEMLHTGDGEEFVETIYEILKYDPQNTSALIYAVQNCLHHKDTDNALRYITELFKSNFAETMVIQLLLQVFWSIEDKEQSLQEFDKMGTQLNPEANYQLSYCKGVHLKALKEYDQSIQVFDELNKQQLFSWNFYQIAIIKNLQGDESACFENLAHTFRLEPELKEDAKKFSELENLRNHPKFIELVK